MASEWPQWQSPCPRPCLSTATYNGLRGSLPVPVPVYLQQHTMALEAVSLSPSLFIYSNQQWPQWQSPCPRPCLSTATNNGISGSLPVPVPVYLQQHTMASVAVSLSPALFMYSNIQWPQWQSPCPRPCLSTATNNGISGSLPVPVPVYLQQHTMASVAVSLSPALFMYSNIQWPQWLSPCPRPCLSTAANNGLSGSLPVPVPVYLQQHTMASVAVSLSPSLFIYSNQQWPQWQSPCPRPCLCTATYNGLSGSLPVPGSVYVQQHTMASVTVSLSPALFMYSDQQWPC